MTTEEKEMLKHQRDLTAVVENLRRNPRWRHNRTWKHFAALVERVRSAQSCEIDLIEVTHLLQSGASLDHAIAAAPNSLENEHKQRQVTAALMLAILLYVRATSTSSKHRSTLTVNAYNTEQVQAHERLTRFRNEVLAHFGTGDDSLYGRWENCRVILATYADMDIIMTPWARANYYATCASDLNLVIFTAVEAAAKWKTEKRNDLLIFLSQLPAGDELQAMIESSQFDPAVFFANPLLETAYKENQQLTTTTWSPALQKRRVPE